MQVKGVLDQEEVLFAKNKGYLYGTHVVVGLPECLVEASKAPHAVPVMQHTRAVAVDEVDACFLVSPHCLHCALFVIQLHAEPSGDVCAVFVKLVQVVQWQSWQSDLPVQPCSNL